MTARNLIRQVVAAVLLSVVFASVAGTVLGYPIGLSYTETGSMEPAIESGDGYIPVPTSLVGPPDTGDVVVFDAAEINNGGLVVHRVVEETGQGYITKGDANPFTDQSNDEPVVTNEQISATALTVGGDVVTIPYVGIAIQTVDQVTASVQRQLAILFGSRMFLGGQGLSLLLVISGGVLYVLSVVYDRSTASHQQPRPAKRRTNAVSARVIIAAVTLVFFAALTGGMVMSGGAADVQYVSTDRDIDRPDTVLKGTETKINYTINNNGVLPMTVIVESDSPRLSLPEEKFRITGQGEKELTATVRVPDETGVYRERLQQRRYLPFLPQETITWLDTKSQVLTILTIASFATSIFAIVAILLVSVDPLRIRRPGQPSLGTRLRRRFEW